MRFRSIAGILVLAAMASACSEYDPTSPEESLAASVTSAIGGDLAVMITGEAGLTASINPIVFITTRLFTDGSVRGRGMTPGGRGGPVVDLTLDGDLWCVKFVDERTGVKSTLLIRDIGDGVNTFDEFGLVGRGGYGFIACSDLSSITVTTAAQGDFKVVVAE